MIQLSAQSKILLATNPMDFRKGIEGLSAICREVLKQNPYSGCYFVFRNRKKTAIKVLVYDGQGFWLCMKRFSEGKLKWWPEKEAALYSLTASQLQILFWNGDPTQARMSNNWRALPSEKASFHMNDTLDYRTYRR